MKNPYGGIAANARVCHSPGAYDDTTLCGKVAKHGLVHVHEQPTCGRCMERVAFKIMVAGTAADRTKLPKFIVEMDLATIEARVDAWLADKSPLEDILTDKTT